MQYTGNARFPRLEFDIRNTIYECLTDSIDEAWVKAGTLGSRVTAKVHDGCVYNKPFIKGVLLEMLKQPASDVTWPGLEYNSQLGARVLRRNMRDNRSNMSKGTEKLPTDFEIVGRPKPEDLHVDSPSHFEGVFGDRFTKHGFMWMSSSNTYTYPLVKNCGHENVVQFIPGSLPRCLSCGLKFCQPKTAEEMQQKFSL